MFGKHAASLLGQKVPLWYIFHFVKQSATPPTSSQRALLEALADGAIIAVVHTRGGTIASMFLMLAYFGCDQSQVQRYLTGRSAAESRMGLLINGAVKVPMQFGVLLIGASVFAFYQFVRPPIFFNPVEVVRVAALPVALPEAV